MGDEGGVLTGLSDGLFDGDLTTGDLTTGTFIVSFGGSSGITRTGLTGIGLMYGFSATLVFFSGFTVDFVLDFGPLPTLLPNGKTTGTNLLFVMPSGISLLLI